MGIIDLSIQSSNDVMLLCETWLKPNNTKATGIQRILSDLSTFTNLKQDLVVYSKE